MRYLGTPAAKLKFATLAFTVLTLCGCNRGSDTVFFTVTNAGLNFESTPPTAEIAVSRREGVIQPEFEGGIHLPVLATMSSRLGIDGERVAATFIGGAAAEIAASKDEVTNEGIAALCVCRKYPRNYSRQTRSRGRAKRVPSFLVPALQ